MLNGIGIGVPFNKSPGLNGAMVGLFAAGEQGAWYDPSDFTTMFQDSAGTVAVTAVEQPVGKILDKSGNGNHATQATSTARPVLRQDASGHYYLDFDGVDDFLVTSAIDFTGTDKMSVFAGLYRDNDVVGMLCELSSDVNTNAGSFFHVVGDALKDYYASSRGTAASSVGQASNITFAGPDLAVFTATHDISGDRTVSRRNGVSGVAGTTDKGLGAFGNYPIYIGMRAGTSLPFNGRIYSLIARGALSDAAQIAAAESYVNSKTGAY